MSLRWIAERWNLSRQTCRRILDRHGASPLYLGGDARNATLRFDRDEVLAIELASRGREPEIDGGMAT